MAPPAKRRKRNVVVSSSSSDSEDENEDDIIFSTPPAASKQSSTRQPAPTQSRTTVKPVPVKLKPPAAKVANHSSSTATKSVPKQKTAKKGLSTSTATSNDKSKKASAGKNGDIQTLFSKQTQSQREVGNRVPRGPLSRTSSLAEDDNDPISDDEIAAPRSGVSAVAATAKKRKQGILPAVQENKSTAPKFKLTTKPIAKEAKVDDDTRPWAERFGPENLGELAVHKRKVADVRAWLEAVMKGSLRQRLLILKGAAGIGKTTTIQLLAKDMNCEVLEWRNADGEAASSDGVLSMSAQFEEFMGRGGKFGQLDIFSSASKTSTEPIPESSDRRKQIILIEEFPSTFSSSSIALQSFRETILRYLAANTPSLSLMYGNNGSSQPITPVVMVVSETLLTTTSALADSFTAHRLLGPEILQHPGINVIEFRDIAATYLAKALDLVIQKESRKSGRRKTPGPLVLQRLGEVGDIRSAVGSLEFLCLQGDSADWSGKVKFGKTKKAKTEPEMTEVEKESLELITRREASLGIFHAVGKVMYNKRDDLDSNSSSAAVERLPEYLSLHSRPRKSQVKIDELIDETGTDTQTFIAALHENYILSCDAPPTSIDFSSIDHVNDCIDALSDSDLLCPDWDGSFNSTGFGGGTGGKGSGGDILRQDELSFQTAVRGILFALPYPVKRRAPAANGLRTGKGAEAFKMFYPTGLKLWRMKEEIESTIDVWVTRLKRGETTHFLTSITAGARAFAKPKPGSVESWSGKNASRSFTSTTKTKGNTTAGDEDVATTPLLATGTSARKEMLLERLPYMVKIAQTRNPNTSTYASLTIKEMEKVTTFSGIAGPTDDIPDEGALDETRVMEEWATDKAGAEESAAVGAYRWKGVPTSRNNNAARGGTSGLGLMEQEVQKLVLSDDDIEDD